MLRIGKSVRSNQEVIENTQLGFINNLINLLKLSEDMMITDKQEFLCALVNGVTQNLKAKGREAGLEFIKKYFGAQITNKSDKLLSMKVVNGTWTEYKQYSPSESDFTKLLDKQIMVGLPSQLKSMDMVKTLVNNCENIIFTGSPGSGKSMIVKNVLHSVKSSSVIHINCNASTSALDLIRRLQAQSLVVNSINGKVYKPKEGSRFILYLQNLNIIDPDIYETIGLVEFLLQILTYKGFYDENLEFVQIENIQMIITMQNPTLRGRNQLSTRFTSRMQLVVMDDLSSEECS
jgi:dynein heavy chain 2